MGDMPKSNIAIMWTLIFKWYVVRGGSKNGHQKDTCSNKIGLHVQTMLTILDSMVNNIGPI